MSYHPINIESLAKIKNNIEQYSPYPKKVQIIAVTKKFSHHAIISAIKNNITCIGENQIQEFDKKQSHLLDYQFESHLIGHLQSNKIIKAIKLFNYLMDEIPMSLFITCNNKCVF